MAVAHIHPANSDRLCLLTVTRVNGTDGSVIPVLVIDVDNVTLKTVITLRDSYPMSSINK
jgi:hypothetical protein